jgi:hypothetical protein
MAKFLVSNPHSLCRAKRIGTGAHDLIAELGDRVSTASRPTAPVRIGRRSATPSSTK